MPFFTATTLAVASLAAGVIGTGVSVYGQSQAADAREAAGKANARQLELTAQAREAETHETLVRQQREARRALAGTRATMANSGTEIQDGSNLDFLGAATTRLETQINEQARQATMETRALRQSASMERYEGSQAKAAGRLQMAGSLIGGFSQAAGAAYQFKREGAL